MSEIKHCAWNGQPDLSLCQKLRSIVVLTMDSTFLHRI